VLIGGDTGSAAEGFAAMMHRMTTAKLVGRETEGALLSSEHFDLSDGWQLVVPVSGLWAADGTDYRDRPTPPDINVTWKPGDLCSGHDPDIEKAKALLNLTATQ
jgi:carboxyl-terminal processing protease